MPAVKKTKKDTTTKAKPVKKAAEKKVTEKKPAAKKVAEKKVAEKNDEESAGSKRKRVQFSADHEGPSNKKTNSPAKKILKKTPVKEEQLESSDDEEEEEKTVVGQDDEEEELTEEQEAAFRKEILGDIASSSEGEDSSDDEDAIDKNEDVVTLDNKKLEKSMTETKKTFDKKSAKSNKAKSEERGVIYVGRIPHGFYEKEMKGYFSQFGDITRLRLSRNKKTGKSKHYAFIEFESEEVAEIVAETMNNYLLFGHMLQCKVIPSEKVHEKLFNGANVKYKPFNYELRNRQILNKPKTDDQLEKKRNTLKKTEERLRKQIKDAGIDYDFPAFK